MRRIYIYMILLAGMLVSCGENNWFFHEVDYTGKSEQPKLCMMADIHAGDSIKVFALRSYFFQDSTRYTVIKDGKYWYRTTKPGFLHHASVLLYVNGASYPMHCVETGTLDELSPCYYTCDYLPKAGDKLRIEISCEGYTSIYAEQEVPYPLDVRMEDWDTTTTPGLAYFTLCFPDSYEGDSSDYVRLSSQMNYIGSYVRIRPRNVWQNGSYVQIGYDTIYDVWHATRTEIFAQSLEFSRYTTSKSMEKGYYGSTVGLYAHVRDLLSERIPVAVPLCPDSLAWMDDEDQVSRVFMLESLDVRVETTKQDAYLLVSSELKKYVLYNSPTNYLSWVPEYIDPSSMTSEDVVIDIDFSEFGDISESLEELMGELGLQEDVQLYSNVWQDDHSPTIGHLCTFAPGLRWKVVPEK